MKAQANADIVLRDRDNKYQRSFDQTFRDAGVRIKRVAYRARNMNAYVERFVQAIEQECLDQFIIFGTEHFDHVCKEYVEHYHTERPHQAMGNLPLIAPSSPPPRNGKVVCRERPGGCCGIITRRRRDCGSGIGNNR
jgi:putative transposase